MFRAKQIQDDYHTLDRAGQVTLIRLRTGHNGLNSYMYRKMNLVPSSLYTCGTEDQTTKYILQSCPAYQHLRQQIWSDGTSLHQNLYGKKKNSRGQLASFSRLAYPCNQANEKKKNKTNNGRYTTNIPTGPHTFTTTDIKINMHYLTERFLYIQYMPTYLNHCRAQGLFILYDCYWFLFLLNMCF